MFQIRLNVPLAIAAIAPPAFVMMNKPFSFCDDDKTLIKPFSFCDDYQTLIRAIQEGRDGQII